MKIGELASKAKCSAETIRYYEKEGLLPAAERSSSNYRSYGDGHLERLRFVRNCRALDMAHDEIRALLGLMDAPDTGCGAVNDLVDAHIGHVDRRIQELTDLRQQLSALRQQCPSERALDTCGILRGLASMDAGALGKRHTHLG